MAFISVFLPCVMVLLSITSMASSAIVEHTFHVQNLTVKPLCKEQVITAVNGSLPGPTINVREGDSLVVHVVNKSPYNMTIHWHGVFQMMSGWHDGANMVTQCPIRPGNNFTYRFNITGQEGTLWWHAHVLILRATVHGALVIRPTRGRPYPFPKPFKEIPIFLGQWWNETVENLQARGFSLGVAPVSDAYLINGLPGDLYACSRNKMYKLTVVQGKRYLLRIINAGLNIHLYFKIANHNLTVVAQDASYTTPYVTDVVVLAPGQTVDALLLADQPAGQYFMASRPYVSGTGLPFTNNVTRALLVYAGSGAGNPISMPVLPEIRDTPTAHKYFTNITGLVGGPHWVPVPRRVDEKMFITVGLGVQPCEPGWWCPGPGGGIYSGSMNNISWEYPTRMSMQQAWYYNVTGIYTDDFPNEPPVKFDFTNLENAYNESLWFIKKATSVKVLKFNSVVEVVLQNTAFVTPENHPIHLHGFNFHILAQGFGNYDPIRNRRKFNFVNPQIRSTVAVPVAGWAVIRFTANNPGVWMFHCHVDAHMPFGISMAFVVENGPTPSTTLPPPPSDLPQCEQFSDE